MEQPIKLVYWNIRGLGEKVRQVLEYCGLPYTQQILLNPEEKPKWFENIKPTLIDKHPAITLPYIVDGDRIVTESDAICVYLCHRSNKVELLGRNAQEQVVMATALGVFNDFYRSYQDLTYNNYSDQAAFQEAVKESIPRFEVYLRKLNGQLGNKEFIAGQITWVDILVADFIQVLKTLCEDYLKDFPKLAEYQVRVWELPGLKEYFASDRFIARPITSPRAYWR